MTDRATLERLEALIQISLPAMDGEQKETDETKILRLCDFDHTREQIATAIGKPMNRVDVVLNALRKVGKIKSLPKDNCTVYIRMRR